MGAELFSFLSGIDPWIWFSIAIVTLPIAAMIGEISILPWLSLSLFFVGIVDFLGFSIEIQLITFSIFFFSSIVFSHRFLSSDSNQPLIAESIGDMVGKSLLVTEIDASNPAIGKAESETGKTWNVQSSNHNNLEKNTSYYCSGYSGITLHLKEK